jgi:hypothetical protein
VRQTRRDQGGLAVDPMDASTFVVADLREVGLGPVQQ